MAYWTLPSSITHNGNAIYRHTHILLNERLQIVIEYRVQECMQGASIRRYLCGPRLIEAPAPTAPSFRLIYTRRYSHRNMHWNKNIVLQTKNTFVDGNTVSVLFAWMQKEEKKKKTGTSN